jgi:hypothetical protein
MVACGSCGGCCGHCGAICGGCSGASAGGIGGAFGGGGFFGGIGYMPYVGGVPFFHHKKSDDTGDGPKVDCDALADPNHPGHREAVKTIAHVDDKTHESMMKRIKEELEKFEAGR